MHEPKNKRVSHKYFKSFHLHSANECNSWTFLYSVAFSAFRLVKFTFEDLCNFLGQFKWFSFIIQNDVVIYIKPVLKVIHVMHDIQND